MKYHSSNIDPVKWGLEDYCPLRAGEFSAKMLCIWMDYNHTL
jgi:hypothetical protein